jgi:hypothetical protein
MWPFSQKIVLQIPKIVVEHQLKGRHAHQFKLVSMELLDRPKEKVMITIPLLKTNQFAKLKLLPVDALEKPAPLDPTYGIKTSVTKGSMRLIVGPTPDLDGGKFVYVIPGAITEECVGKITGDADLSSGVELLETEIRVNVEALKAANLNPTLVSISPLDSLPEEIKSLL